MTSAPPPVQFFTRLLAHAATVLVILTPLALALASVWCGWTADWPAWAELAAAAVGAGLSAVTLPVAGRAVNRRLAPHLADRLQSTDSGPVYNVASAVTLGVVFFLPMNASLRLAAPEWLLLVVVLVAAVVSVAALGRQVKALTPEPHPPASTGV